MLNSRKANETFYQNNSVELNDEALANVVGGCGDDNACDHNGGWDNSNGNCNSWGNGDSWGNHSSSHGCRHHSVLGDLLCDLL